MGSVSCEVRCVGRQQQLAADDHVLGYGPALGAVELECVPRPGDLVQWGPDVARVVSVLHRPASWSEGRRLPGVVLLCWWVGPERGKAASQP